MARKAAFGAPIDMQSWEGRVRDVCYEEMSGIPSAAYSLPVLTGVMSKKVIEGGEEKVISLCGDKAVYMAALSEIKPFFTVLRLPVEVIRDTGSGRLGFLLTTTPVVGHVGEVSAWMMDAECMRSMGRILVLDAVVGYVRSVREVLYTFGDFRLVSIETGDMFRFYLPPKSSFPKALHRKICLFIHSDGFMPAYLDEVRSRSRDIRRVLSENGIGPIVCQEIQRRIDLLHVTAKEVFAA